jgi:hypothetical protein
MSHPPSRTSSLNKKYQKWNALSLILFLVIAGALIYFGSILFQSLNRSLTGTSPRILFTILPEHYTWIFCAACFSIVLSGYLTMLTMRAVLQERHEEFVLYGEFKSGINANKFFMRMMIVLLPIGMLLLFFLSDYSVKILNNNIIVDEFAGLENRTYSFYEISSIQHISNSRRKNATYYNPHYHITFIDNSYWNTDEGLNPGDQGEKIILFLKTKTGLHVDSLLLDPYMN